MMRATLTFGLLLLAVHHARANPPVDEVKQGDCIKLKLDGKITPCNNDFRLVATARSASSPATTTAGPPQRRC